MQYGNIEELGVLTIERANNGVPTPILTIDGTALSGSTFTGASGVDSGDDGEGISIVCGAGNTSGGGGDLLLQSGGGAGAGDGGEIFITASTSASGAGGGITAVGGAGGAVGGAIAITAGAATAGPGGAANVTAGDGTTVGGAAGMQAGSASAGPGGALDFAAGDGGGTGAGGGVSIGGGDSSGVANAGDVDVTGGSGGTTSEGGTVTLRGGDGGSVAGQGGDIILHPGAPDGDTANGAVVVNPVSSGAGNTGELRFLELGAGGTNFTGWKAPDALDDDVMYTMPVADAASSGFVLSSDSAGALSWIDPSSGGHSFQASYNGGAAFTSAASTTGSADGAVRYTALLNTGAAFQINTVGGAESRTMEFHTDTGGAAVHVPVMSFYEGGTFSGTGTEFGNINLVDFSGTGINFLSITGADVTGTDEAGSVAILGGNAVDATSGAAGTGTVQGGMSSGTADAGTGNISGGTSTGTGDGGLVQIVGGPATGSAGDGGDITMASGTAATTVSASAGNLSISIPNSSSANNVLSITAGNATSTTTNAPGSQVTIDAGDGSDSGSTDGGNGGQVAIGTGIGGTATGGDVPGDGGNLVLNTGAAGTGGAGGGSGGDITLSPGDGADVATHGRVRILNDQGSVAKELVFEADNGDETGFVAGATGPGSTNLIYVFPVDVPTAGQHLTAAAPASGRSVLTWEDGGTGGSALGTFGDGDLTGTTYVFNHALGSQFVGIELYDNNDNVLQPDDVAATDANNSTIELSTIIAANGGTLPGGAASWNVRATS